MNRNFIALHEKTDQGRSGEFVKTLLLTSALSLISVTASTAESAVLEEIVVTAQKRAENIQKVSISITAFSASQIEDRNIVGLTDLAKATPNLSYLSDGTMKNTAPSIRGVFGPGAAQAGMDTPLATYVDEVYMGTTVGQNLDLYDVERIEVLRGPQGTLFGRNALSGLINIVTPTPGNDIKAYGEGTYGNYDLVRLRAGISGPLVKDRLYASISGSFTDRGGFVTNRYTGHDVNDEGNWGVRGKFVFTPDDAFKITAAVDYREVDQTTRTYDIAGFNGQPGFLFQPFGPAEVDTDPFDRNISQDFEGQETLEEFGVSVTVDADFEWAALKTISAYRTHDYFQSYDADNTEIPITIRETPEDLDAFSQEIRLTSNKDGAFEWIIGANYYYQKTVNEFASLLNNDTLVGDRLISTLMPPGTNGLPPQPVLDFLYGIGLIGAPDTLGLLTSFGLLVPPFGETRSIGVTTLNSYAGYAHGVYHVTEQVNLNLGVRYTHEDKSFSYVQTSATGNQFFLLPEIPASDSKESFHSFTPAVGLDYFVNDDVMLYAKAAKGFKSGGFNDGFASTPGNAFSPETLWNFEAGAKTTFWGGRARANLAAFYMDWKDVQTIFSEIPEGSVIPFFTVDTAGDIEIKGMELETIFQLTDALTVTGGVGITDAQFSSITPRFEALGATKGQSVKNVPKYTLAGGISYAFSLGNAGTLTAAADVQYRDSVPLTNIETGVPNTQDGYALVDATLTYQDPDGRWTVQLWGKNLTDKQFVTAMFDVDNTPSSPIRAAYHSLGAPRTYGIKVRYSY